MFCPMFVWITPIILYILFYYTSMSIRVFYNHQVAEGAQSSEDDTSYLIFIFTNIVFIGAINASYGYYLIREVTHSCGPYLGMSYAIQAIYSRTNIITMYKISLSNKSIL